MISLFQPGEAVSMAGFNQRLQGILNALPSQNLKIAAGSYVGTGASGSSNPNTLSFNFAPAILLVCYASGGRSDHQIIIQGSAYSVGGTGYEGSGQFWSRNCSVAYSNNGKMISWYDANSSPSEYTQLNLQDKKYQYFAIGA